MFERKGNTFSFGLTNTQELTPIWGFYSSKVFLGTRVDFHITFLWSLALGIQSTRGRVPVCGFFYSVTEFLCVGFFIVSPITV